MTIFRLVLEKIFQERLPHKARLVSMLKGGTDMHRPFACTGARQSNILKAGVPLSQARIVFRFARGTIMH